ncbi:hypothetical protein [Arthrobacter sp. E3]|uniref:hypothetical protein n=1 Tax=Arthrobacter sp. E3 TaxID=517402 RepID=UPI001A942ABB|nr:hypothetical protein [Arthrobacter sp. E3]
MKRQLRTLLNNRFRRSRRARQETPWRTCPGIQAARDKTALLESLLGWKEIETLTGTTTGEVNANSTSIKHIKGAGRIFGNSANHRTRTIHRGNCNAAVNNPLQ